MSDHERKTPKPSEPMGWQDLIEDLVGVNLRGLRTLAAAFTQPAKLFASARARDWDGGVYSPSVRVYIFLVAVLVFFQFIWADTSSPSVEILRQRMAELAEIDPRLGEPFFLERVMNLFVLVFPIAALFCTFLGSLVMRVWGAGTPLLARIRLYFAAVLPSTLLQLFGTVGMSFLPITTAAFGVWLVLLVYWTADAITTYRGLSQVHTRRGRVWRSILLGTFNALIIMLASIVTGTIAMNWEIERILAAP
ncbi:MAG: hypothetical protein AAGI03_03665 [Pseudomonadota bacterium]